VDSYVILKKSDLDTLISKLSAKREVVAPVKRGVKNFAFESVTSAKEISLTYVPTILPPKKYFMPQREKIQEFDREIHQWKPIINSEHETVIFAIHTCDLSGVQFLNTVMEQDPQDVNYLSKKRKILLIGLECNKYCDEYASCKVMKNHLPSGGYDLFMTDLGDSFMVHVASPAGEALVKETGFFTSVISSGQKKFEEIRSKKEKIFKDEMNVKHEELKGLFERSFDSPVWEDLDRRCVACGNCTNVCPTCYCFDIRDELNLDLKTGFRYRVWDGCQNEEFAKVAGGENFRHKRGHRQRHRYNRKFNYPVEKFNRYTCTGCGRCSRTCMAKISLKETINALVAEVK
jgi:sulfhydrogenase subunit beta (sulfur reductase)